MSKENQKAETAIKIEKVSKSFDLRKNKGALVERFFRLSSKKKEEVVWALNKVSLEIRQGESLAIIGHNGSGKSTLLQLICGTLRQTEGNIKVNGKIGALLELGSGFNPEFTGRENIYLNAMLLGLKKSEVKRKINEIIDFSEIRRFIDQPVKTYSSGMVVRLAFSVVIHINADILIVDEALSVGDAYFNQKCMRYIQRFKEKGTLIFVSHDMNAVMNVCDKTVWLDNGNVVANGLTKQVVDRYIKTVQERNGGKIGGIEKVKEVEMGEKEELVKENIDDLNKYRNKWTDYRIEAMNKSKYTSNYKIMYFDDKSKNEESYGGTKAKITKVKLTSLETNNEICNIGGGEIVRLTIVCETNIEVDSLISGFIIKNDKGLTISGDNSFNTTQMENINTRIERGCTVSCEFIFTMPLLQKGKYFIVASIANGSLEKHDIMHWINDAVMIESTCNNTAAGIAGIPMHSIKLKS